MKSITIMLILICMSASASASTWWNSELRDHLGTLRTSFSNNFASTMLGACRVKKLKYKEIDDALIEQRRVRVDSMNSGHLPSVFVLQNNKGIAVPAPVMFVLPGAFTTTQSAQPVRMSKRFHKMGYHVITLPNPWGLEFIAQRPYFSLGTFVKEGEALYKAIVSAHEILESRHLIKGTVSVMGISGGGYNTAMVAGMDSMSGAPIITGYSTSISAPMIWSQTMKHLDTYMNDVKERLNTSMIRLFPRYLKICRRDDQDEYDDELLEDAKLLTIKGGFHDHMINSVKLFDKINNLQSIPRKGFKTWRKNVNFEFFYKNYNREGLKVLHSKWGRIDTWVNLAKSNGYNKLRIVTSIDDFLNVPEVYSELDIEKERLLLIPFGGHWGIRGFGAWFDKLFELSFDPKYINL